MTVATTGDSAAVVPYTGDMEGLGLEDVSASDLSVPRLNIIGKHAVFQNSLTQEQFSELNVILISQIKQRVMFHQKVDENYKRPQCRSTDFEVGFPNVDPKAPVDRLFPWAEGNFQEEAGKEGLYLPQVKEETGLPALPCDKCKFKDWEAGKTRCKEQHVYPLLYQDNDGFWTPAILTIKGSGIKASKTYVGGFATSRQPLFTVITHLSLTPASKGSVDYAIPVFRKVGGSDPANYEEYARSVHDMRAYLRRWPTTQEETEASNELEAPPNVNAGPTVIEYPVAPPVAPPAPVAEATPAPAAQIPVEPPPAPPAMPAEPVAPPVAQPAQQPAAEVIPPGFETVWATMPDAAKQAILASQPAATPAPVAQPAPVAPPVAPPASTGSSDELPF